MGLGGGGIPTHVSRKHRAGDGKRDGKPRTEHTEGWVWGDGGREAGREVVDTETHTGWVAVHSCAGCALHKGLTVLEIMDLCIQMTTSELVTESFLVLTMWVDYNNFPTDNVFCGKGVLFKFAQRCLMIDSRWPCTEPRKRRGCLSLSHACVRTHTQPSRDREKGQTESERRDRH